MHTYTDIIDKLKLQVNTIEGGFFESTYISKLQIADMILSNFPPTQKGRPLCSAIYYFIEGDNFSALHKVTGDMIYHFYSGDPAEMLLLHPDGKTEVSIFSSKISEHGGPMKIITGGTWLGTRLLKGGSYALMGVSMSPGFDLADYTIGNREALIKQYPNRKKLIEELTRI